VGKYGFLGVLAALLDTGHLGTGKMCSDFGNVLGQNLRITPSSGTLSASTHNNSVVQLGMTGEKKKKERKSFLKFFFASEGAYFEWLSLQSIQNLSQLHLD
jgi:hypothetical protein